MKKQLIFSCVQDIHVSIEELKSLGANDDCLLVMRAMLSGIVVKEDDTPEIMALHKSLNSLVSDLSTLIANSTYHDKVVGFNKNFNIK